MCRVASANRISAYKIVQQHRVAKSVRLGWLQCFRSTILRTKMCPQCVSMLSKPVGENSVCRVLLCYVPIRTNNSGLDGLRQTDGSQRNRLGGDGGWRVSRHFNINMSALWRMCVCERFLYGFHVNVQLGKVGLICERRSRAACVQTNPTNPTTTTAVRPPASGVHLLQIASF